jgi:hypothetical protein
MIASAIRPALGAFDGTTQMLVKTRRFSPIQITQISLLALLFAVSNAQSAVGAEVVDRNIAAKRFSGALFFWRSVAGASSESLAKLKQQFTRPNETAPVSWRFVATALELDSIGDRPKDFELQWDSEANADFRNQESYRALYGLTNIGVGVATSTCVMALHGAGTAVEAITNGDKLESVPADAIVLCEVKDSNVHWMEPDDLQLDSIPRAINPSNARGISGNLPDGFFVGFADGSVWFMDRRTPFEAIERFFTVESADSFDRDKILGKHCIERYQPWEEWFPR